MTDTRRAKRGACRLSCLYYPNSRVILNHPITKSRAAFLMSAEKLFNEHKQIYFWTFTFKSVCYDSQAMFLWSNFRKQLWNFYGQSFMGLRVVEVHPGRMSHGLHFHALISKRLNIHIVRKIGKRWGFGRMSVEKADEDSALYLAKYISKENELAPGIRRWAAIGGFKQVKVSKIECESILSNNIQWIQKRLKLRQFTYAFFIYINQQTQIHGKMQNWPTLKFVTLRNSQAETVKEITEPDDPGIYPKTRIPFTFIKIKEDGEWVSSMIPFAKYQNKNPF